ncbi:hypothetical protein CF319_g8530 [Tilletia indica]|nr:hypothetical protein CF319_g8530 [Tilletia indica]
MDKSVSSSDLPFQSADCREHSAYLILNMTNNTKNNTNKQQQHPAQTKRKGPPTHDSGSPAKQQVGSIFTENTTINFVLSEGVAEEEADDVHAGTGIEAIEQIHEALLLLNTHAPAVDAMKENNKGFGNAAGPLASDPSFPNPNPSDTIGDLSPPGAQASVSKAFRKLRDDFLLKKDGRGDVAAV